MKIAEALEGGIAGATTLGLLEKALQGTKTKAPDLKLLTKPGIIKKLKKKSKKKGGAKVFINVAKELLAAGAYYGVAKVGKRKNVLLRGGLLGALTGLCMAFIAEGKDRDQNQTEEELFRDKFLTIALYTAGGLLAGAAIKKVRKKRRKK
jgi:hypothetical protein